MDHYKMTGKQMRMQNRLGHGVLSNLMKEALSLEVRSPTSPDYVDKWSPRLMLDDKVQANRFGQESGLMKTTNYFEQDSIGKKRDYFEDY